MAKSDELEPSSLDKLIGAIQQMATMQADMMARGSQPHPEQDLIMAKLTAALERVSENSIKGAEIAAASYRQVHRPSNEVVHGRSVFHPRGNENLHPAGSTYSKPLLACKMFVPREEQPGDNMLTREEIELLNILAKAPGSYVIKRNDDTKIKMSVKVDYALDEVTPSKLVISHDTGYNNEYFRLMPTLHSQLRQMLAQHSDVAVRTAATQVLTMEEEEALIQAGSLSVAA